MLVATFIRVCRCPCLFFVAGRRVDFMDRHHKCDEGGEAVKSPSKKPYAEPMLLALGSFSDLTLTIGPSGNNDGGSQRGRRSTRF